MTFSSVCHLPQPDVPPFILMGRNRLEDLGWTATAGIKALERTSTRHLIRLRNSRVATTIFTVYRTMELATAAINHAPKVKMSAAEVHILTGHAGDDDMRAWAAAYHVHMSGDFTSTKCHQCLISNIAKTAVREAHTHPEVSPIDKSTCLVVDFNVWLGAKNPGKARTGNKQLLNVIHPKTLTVMTAGTKTTKDGYDAMRTILTRLLNHLRKHGHPVDTIYCDKESIFMSDRMRTNIGLDFNVTVLPAPTDNHAFMGEIETFNRVQAAKIRVALQHKEIPSDIWDLIAMEYHAPLYNRLPKRSRGGLSPWELVTGRRPSCDLFFSFATPVVVKDHQLPPGKGSDDGLTGYLVGYDLASMLNHSRVVYVPESNTIVRSRDYRLYDPVTKVETVPSHLVTTSTPVDISKPRTDAEIVSAMSATDYKAP